MSERPNRRSQRLGRSVILDFKVLSFRGRESDMMTSEHPNKKQEKVKFFKQQSFSSYEDMMRFVKTYESQHSVRLNASMITPGRQPSVTPDGQYYRFVAFWCNFNPRTKHLSAYTPITHRYCPFFVRATGCEETNSLIVTELLVKHSHTDNGNVFGAPPLPPALKTAAANTANKKRHAQKRRVRLTAKAKRRNRVRLKQRQEGSKENPAVTTTVEGNRPNPPVPEQPDSSRMCVLCDQTCPSTEAYVGHVWLVHQILTERLNLHS